MRIIKNDKGSYCTDCRQENNCICFPDDEMVDIEYRKILKETNKATLFLLKKQKLSTGKIIKTGTEIWFPDMDIYRYNDNLKILKVKGSLINRMTNK